MIISPHPQQTPGWLADRVGMLTTSEFSKLFTPAKLEISKSIDEYLAYKATEWWLGRPLKAFGGTAWTEHGTRMEPESRQLFSVATGYHTTAVGFIRRSKDEPVGTSVDSLVCDQEPDLARPAYYACGVLECKSPSPWVHAMYCRHVEETGEAPRAHHLQIQGQLWVTGLPRAWFQSYYPEAPQCVVEVAPDPETQDVFDEHMPEIIRKLLDWREWYTSHGCEPSNPQDWAAEQELEAGGWEGAA